MSAIKHAVQAIEHGIEGTFKGVVDVLKCAATLDFKGMGKGVNEAVHGVMATGRGVIDSTPMALAANTLMHGGLDKAMQKFQKLEQKLSDGAINGVAGDFNQAKLGVIHTGKGIAEGDLSKAAGGFKDIVEGGAKVAMDVTPGLGEAKAGLTVAEVGIGTAKEAATNGAVSAL